MRLVESVRRAAEVQGCVGVDGLRQLIAAQPASTLESVNSWMQVPDLDAEQLREFVLRSPTVGP